MKEVYKRKSAVRQILHNMKSANAAENGHVPSNIIESELRRLLQNISPPIPSKEIERRIKVELKNGMSDSNETSDKPKIPHSALPEVVARRISRKEVVKNGRGLRK